MTAPNYPPGMSDRDLSYVEGDHLTDDEEFEEYDPSTDDRPRHRGY